MNLRNSVLLWSVCDFFSFLFLLILTNLSIVNVSYSFVYVDDCVLFIN